MRRVVVREPAGLLEGFEVNVEAVEFWTSPQALCIMSFCGRRRCRERERELDMEQTSSISSADKAFGLDVNEFVKDEETQTTQK